VTGGVGCLGSHLVESLAQLGGEVLVLDNFVTSSRSSAEALKKIPGVTVVEFDISQRWSECRELTAFAAEGLSHVFHLASPASPTKYVKLSLETMWANSTGLGEALDLATRTGARLVFTSSSEVYGFTAPPHVESAMGLANSFGPRACYVEGKRFGEALVFSYNQRYGTKHGVVRIFNTYGPRMSPDDGRVILNLMSRAVRGEPLKINGDGKQTRSFCYVDDLNRGLLAYGSREISQPLNLGNDRQISILELAVLIREMVGRPNLLIEHLPSVQDEPIHRQPDLTQSLSMLNPWRPEVDLTEGLRRTLSWISGATDRLEEMASQDPVPVAAV